MTETPILVSSPARRWRALLSWKWLLAALIAAPAIYAAAAPWTFSEPALRMEIARQVARATGLRLDTRARFTFALLPQPTIKIEDPIFGDSTGGVNLGADYLKGSLRLLPLLAGRLEMARVSLARPSIRIDLDIAPGLKAGAIGRMAVEGLRPETAETLETTRLGIVSLTGGSAQIFSKTQALDLRVDNINMVVDWRNIGAPLSLTGTASLHGEPTDLALWVARPGGMLRGEQSPVTLRMKNGALSLSTTGTLALGLRPQFAGRVAASGDSLRGALDFIGSSTPLPTAFRNLSLTGDATIMRNSASLTNLSFSADGNDYEGTLAWRLEDGRPLISGTLATNLLTLAPFLAEAPAIVGQDGQWSREALDLRELAEIDLDLRVSAARARLGRMQAEDAALSIMLKNGRIEIGLAELKTYKGALKGRFSAQAASGGGVEGRATLGFVGIDVNPLLWDLWGRSKVSGLATGSVIMTGNGESFAQIVRNLDGRGQIQINQGDISGIDIEQALRRIEKRPLVSSFEMRNGRTSFETLNASLRVSKGVAAIEDGLLAGKGARVTFAGAAQIPERTLQIDAEATQAAGNGAARKDAPQFPFTISGHWDDPNLSFDAQSLIRRSGAAQPLLPREPVETPKEPAEAAPPTPTETAPAPAGN